VGLSELPEEHPVLHDVASIPVHKCDQSSQRIFVYDVPMVLDAVPLALTN
jgi:hypothetical protein